MENSSPQIENHHGVFMNISGHGVLIIGEAAIGKSSFALELISQGHQLIADDITEFTYVNKTVLGQCPPLLKGFLHTRELGLISVPIVFGEAACLTDHPLHYVLELVQQSESMLALSIPQKHYAVQEQLFPMITLSTQNPATLISRLLCWISMQSQQHPEYAFNKLHHATMEVI